MSIAKKIKILIFLLAVAGLLAVVASVRATNNSIFSVSVWTRASSSVASKAIMGKAEEMRVATDATGHPLCQIRATTWQTAVISSSVISVNQWSHIVCTYDRTNFKIFINGELKGTQALTAVADDTAALWELGRDASAGTPYGNFTGLVDAYKFYTYALGEDEIKTLYNGGSALVMGGGAVADNNGTAVTGEAAKYCVPGDTAKCDKPVLELKMDEMSGATAYDKSGNGNNWTLNGATWEPAGKIGGALSFDGVDDIINISNTPSILEGKSAFTIGFWAKSDMLLPISKGLFHNTVNNNQRVVDIHIMANKTYNFVVYDSSGSSIALQLGESVVFPDTEWHYITNVFDGKASVYVDGVYKGMSASSITSSRSGSSGKRFDVGHSANIVGYWQGPLDDFKIYNYARTQEQILEDMGASAGASASRGAALKSPVMELNFDEGYGDTAYNGGIGTSIGGALNSGGSGANDINTKMWDKGGKFGGAMELDGDDYVRLPDFSY